MEVSADETDQVNPNTLTNLISIDEHAKEIQNYEEPMRSVLAFLLKVKEDCPSEFLAVERDIENAEMALYDWIDYYNEVKESQPRYTERITARHLEDRILFSIEN